MGPARKVFYQTFRKVGPLDSGSFIKFDANTAAVPEKVRLLQMTAPQWGRFQGEGGGCRFRRF